MRPKRKGGSPSSTIDISSKKEIITQHGYRDRIFLSFSKTVQVKEYEPANVQVSIGTDVLEGETYEDAFERITAPLSKKMIGEVKPLESLKKKHKQ